MQIKTKPQNMVPFSRNKNAALFYDGDHDKFVCAFGYQPLPGDTEYSFNEEYICSHPLEALTYYEGSFYPYIRIAYGDWLEQRVGYHRHNGTKLQYKEK